MINWDRVAELKADIGADEFPEVVELFLQEVDAVIARLREGAAPTAEDMHFLKGGALNLGLDRFAACCAAAETALSAGGEPPAKDHLLDLYSASRAALVAGDASAA